MIKKYEPELRQRLKLVNTKYGFSYKFLAQDVLDINYGSLRNWVSGSDNYSEDRLKTIGACVEKILYEDKPYNDYTRQEIKQLNEFIHDRAITDSYAYAVLQFLKEV